MTTGRINQVAIMPRHLTCRTPHPRGQSTPHTPDQKHNTSQADLYSSTKTSGWQDHKCVHFWDPTRTHSAEHRRYELVRYTTSDIGITSTQTWNYTRQGDTQNPTDASNSLEPSAKQRTYQNMCLTPPFETGKIESGNKTTYFRVNL